MRLWLEGPWVADAILPRSVAVRIRNPRPAAVFTNPLTPSLSPAGERGQTVSHSLPRRGRVGVGSLL
ncbi:hypothetical protein GCM10027034_07270 [Ramlibacter solisilvae]